MDQDAVRTTRPPDTAATAPQAYLPLSNVEDACFLSRASFRFFAALCFCFLFLSLLRGDLSPISVTISRGMWQPELTRARYDRELPATCGILGGTIRLRAAEHKVPYESRQGTGRPRWTSSAHGRTTGDPTTRGSADQHHARRRDDRFDRARRLSSARSH